MKVPLKRTPREFIALSGVAFFLLGLVLLFSGAVFYPAFTWMLYFGVASAEAGLGLIVLRAFLAFFFKVAPRLRLIERADLEVEFEVEPTLHTGEEFQCEMTVVPPRTFTVQSWSVTLVGIREWGGECETEGERIFELTNTQTPFERFTKNKPATFKCSLFVPQEARPSSKDNDQEVTWFLQIELKSFLRGGFKGEVPVRVVAEPALHNAQP